MTVVHMHSVRLTHNVVHSSSISTYLYAFRVHAWLFFLVQTRVFLVVAVCAPLFPVMILQLDASWCCFAILMVSWYYICDLPYIFSLGTPTRFKFFQFADVSSCHLVKYIT